MDSGRKKSEFQYRPRGSMFVEQDVSTRRERAHGTRRRYKEIWSDKASGMPDSYKKLLRNTAVCAFIALSIWGVKSMDGDMASRVVGGQPVETNIQADEDLGRLKYVDGEISSAPIEASAGGYSLPMEGEVVETFADSDKDVKIKGEGQAKVKAILSGVVASTGDEGVTIRNDNGTTTTYTGVVPTVRAGQAVVNSDEIGYLAEEILSVETVGGVGYMDSLNVNDISGMGK